MIFFKNIPIWLGMVAHVYNPSYWFEASLRQKISKTLSQQKSQAVVVCLCHPSYVKA
jgi:hypothetical protein